MHGTYPIWVDTGVLKSYLVHGLLYVPSKNQLSRVARWYGQAVRRVGGRCTVQCSQKHARAICRN